MLIIEASEQPISIVQLTLIKSTSVFLSDWMNDFGMSTVNVNFKFSRHSFWSALVTIVNERAKEERSDFFLIDFLLVEPVYAYCCFPPIQQN